jgi:hypothetical protein
MRPFDSLRVALTKVLSFALGLGFIGLAIADESELRSFSSTDGSLIRAQLTSYSPTNGVSMKLENGRQVDKVPLSRFSDADRQFIETWAKAQQVGAENAPLKADSNIKIFVNSSEDDSLNQKGDPDNLEVKYEPGINFENLDEKLSFKSVGGTLVFIGQSVIEKNEYHILYRQDFTVDLPTGEKVRWQGTPFTNTVDSNPSNGSAFGAEYVGYLVVLRDGQNRGLKVKASKSQWEDCYEAIIKADMRQGHSRDFSKSSQKSVF